MLSEAKCFVPFLIHHILLLLKRMNLLRLYSVFKVQSLRCFHFLYSHIEAMFPQD